MSKTKFACLYCEGVLEECVGAMGICPNCREVWSEEDYAEVLAHPCPRPGCGEYPRIKQPLTAPAAEYIYDYRCLQCDYEWNKKPPLRKPPVDVEPVPLTLDMDALVIQIENEMKKADKKYGLMEDPEEGWYTAECEFIEWKKEVFRRNKNPEDAAKECIQLITMGCKWLRDCLPMMIEEKEKKDGDN